LALLVSFLYLFTGDLTRAKLEWMFTYSYFIMGIFLSSFAAFFFLTNEVGLEWAGFESYGPIGVVRGCVEVAESCKTEAGTSVATGWPPCDLRCNSGSDQWLINLGGSAQKELCAHPVASSPPSETKPPETKAPEYHTKIRGGLAVPVYIAIIALFGGLVSMTRRVPEYQARIGPNSRNPIGLEEAREYLVFQMVQAATAPAIATVAYYTLEPSTAAGSIALAFIAGFSSETVLLLIRSAVEKLKPEISERSPIEVAPTFLDFGDVKTGSSKPLTVVVTNRYPTKVTLTRDVTVSGAGFALADPITADTVLEPKQNLTITVTFAPATETAHEDQLAIYDDAAGSPRQISLKGKGIA
jgi:hypothetical protein